MHILFKQLFNSNFEQLLKYAYRYVNDWQAAEDIVQEVFLSLWLKRKDIDFDEPMKSYLYKATYRKAINYITSFNVQKKMSLQTSDEMINQIILDFNQYDTLLAKEVTQEIRNHVETLPPQCKKVFLLSMQDDKKNREIAELLNINIKTVEKHISRALSDIRRHLLKRGYLPITVLINLFVDSYMTPLP